MNDKFHSVGNAPPEEPQHKIINRDTRQCKSRSPTVAPTGCLRTDEYAEQYGQRCEISYRHSPQSHTATHGNDHLVAYGVTLRSRAIHLDNLLRRLAHTAYFARLAGTARALRGYAHEHAMSFDAADTTDMVYTLAAAHRCVEPTNTRTCLSTA